MTNEDGQTRPLSADDPREIADYKIISRLGSGGMGRVYIGERAAGEQLAIKVLRADLLSDPVLRRRFVREVKAARRVPAAYTAEIVDADPYGDPPWLASRLINGPSLASEVYERGPLSIQATKLLIAGVAKALITIHGAGIAHRDLKPSNILLAEDGPRVIDFGVAYAVDATELTKTGNTPGTPAYMAPEQLSGNTISATIDIFALGSVAYFAATGYTAFQGENAMAIALNILYRDPELDRAPAELRPLIERCLEKDPSARPTLREIANIHIDGRVHTFVFSAGWYRPIANDAQPSSPSNPWPEFELSPAETSPNASGVVTVALEPSKGAVSGWRRRRLKLALVATIVVITALAAALYFLRSFSANRDAGLPEVALLSGSTGPSPSLIPAWVTVPAQTSKYVTLVPIVSLTNKDRYPITAISLNNSGNMLATADTSGFSRLYISNGSTYIETLSIHQNAKKPSQRFEGKPSVTLSPDGTLIATSMGYETFDVWDTKKGDHITRIVDPQGSGVTSLTLSPDDKYIASTDYDGEAFLWTVKSGQELHEISVTHGSHAAVHLSFTLDSGTFAEIDSQGEVSSWDVGSGQPNTGTSAIPFKAVSATNGIPVSGPIPSGGALVASVDWNLLAFGAGSKLSIWGPLVGDIPVSLVNPSNTGCSTATPVLALSASGNALAESCNDHVFLWNIGPL